MVVFMGCKWNLISNGVFFCDYVLNFWLVLGLILVLNECWSCLCLKVFFVVSFLVCICSVLVWSFVVLCSLCVLCVDLVWILRNEVNVLLKELISEIVVRFFLIVVILIVLLKVCCGSRCLSFGIWCRCCLSCCVFCLCCLRLVCVVLIWLFKLGID